MNIPIQQWTCLAIAHTHTHTLTPTLAHTHTFIVMLLLSRFISPHRSYDRPKMIDSFQGKHVRDIACGSCHSAVITSNGELYCWGLGDHGRLGHGDTATQTKPKQVRIEKARVENYTVK